MVHWSIVPYSLLYIDAWQRLIYLLSNLYVKAKPPAGPSVCILQSLQADEDTLSASHVMITNARSQQPV